MQPLAPSSNLLSPRALIASAFLSFVTFATPVWAEDCAPLTLLSSLDMTPMRNGLEMVPVSVNGVPKMFLLATAGGATSINRRVVASLGLKALDVPWGRRMVNRAADSTQAYVAIQTLAVGAMRAENLTLLVAGPAENEINPNLPFDGALAPDLMNHDDVELDFTANKFNYFSPKHCEGHVVYWKNAGITAVPFKTDRTDRFTLTDTHIRVPVTIDGQGFMAVVNTGETRSTMTANVAKYDFGITADSPGSVPLGTLEGDPVFGHAVKTLSFGGVTVSNPEIAIIPNVVGNKLTDVIGKAGGRGELFDNPDLAPQVTVGMDVLRKLHLYIAFEEHKLYITAAAAPRSDVPITGPAAAQ